MEESKREEWNFIFNINIHVTDKNGVLTGCVPYIVKHRAIHDFYEAVGIYLAFEIYKREFEVWQDKGWMPRTFGWTFY